MGTSLKSICQEKEEEKEERDLRAAPRPRNPPPVRPVPVCSSLSAVSADTCANSALPHASAVVPPCTWPLCLSTCALRSLSSLETLLVITSVRGSSQDTCNSPCAMTRSSTNCLAV